MELIFATQNENKVKEIQKLFPAQITIKSLLDIGCTEDIPETQPTIEGNAIQKANYIKMKYNKDCFADDTGLEVMALNGAPGVHSARYAGPEKNSKKNIEKLLSSLEKTANRSAQFKTVIALHYKGELIQFEGICEGKITRTAKGSGGFGYDPIFKPSVKDKTFAELTLKEKNEIGHRGIAVAKLIAFFNKHS